MISTAIVSVVAACAGSLLLTAAMRRTAFRVGLVDQPDRHRKLHGRAVPLGGGIAVFLATVGVLTALITLPNPLRAGLWESISELSVLLLAGTVVVVVGLVDDKVKLRGRYKLLGQLLAALILVYGGLVIDRIGIFGWQIRLGWLAVPFTLFWLLGAINAVNLLDGIDGLATTVGIILSTTVAAMAIVAARPPEVALVAVILAASLAGFLRFNFPPAKIFLGDAGSMFIGLMVGALSIQGSLKGPGTVLLAAPLAVWTIPILDSAAAILRRTLTGRSIYSTDRDHLHHRLLDFLGSNRKVLAWIGLSCAVTSIAALLSVMLASDALAVITGLGLVMVFVATGLFGRAELLLLGFHLRRLGRMLVLSRSPWPTQTREACVRFQGSRTWELFWETFTESVDKLGLSKVYLDINLPAVKEGCHAVWEREDRNQRDRCWHLKFPIVVEGQRVGWLKVTGGSSHYSTCQTIQRLLEMIEPFEKELVAEAGGNGATKEAWHEPAAMEEISL